MTKHFLFLCSVFAVKHEALLNQASKTNILHLSSLCEIVDCLTDRDTFHHSLYRILDYTFLHAIGPAARSEITVSILLQDSCKNVKVEMGFPRIGKGGELVFDSRASRLLIIDQPTSCWYC